MRKDEKAAYSIASVVFVRVLSRKSNITSLVFIFTTHQRSVPARELVRLNAVLASTSMSDESTFTNH